ncbi:hypothetical protein NUSPORA_00492 [Nucleospora cyclopteri]
MLRSEKMQSIAIYIGGKNIRETVEKLGNLNILQFKPPLQAGENVSLKNIEKLEQRLFYIKSNLAVKDQEYETTFEEMSDSVSNYHKKLIDLKHKNKELNEKKKVLEENYEMILESFNFITSVSTKKKLSIFNFATAIIERDKKFLIKKIIKSSLKNNCYIKMIDVDLKYSCRPKAIFVVYVYGMDSEIKLIEVLKTMGARVLTDIKSILIGSNILSEDLELIDTNRRYDTISKIRKDIKKTVLKQKLIRKEINKVNEEISNMYKTWKLLLNKERKIYETLNLLENNGETRQIYENAVEITNSSFLGECWIKKKDLEELEKFKNFRESSRFYFEKIKKRSKEIVPTAFTSNKFTEGFQNLTNVFGVPKYREINPAIFMIFTFPFMFGAMFGDVFHGLILLLISGLMILRFDRLNHNCGVLQILLEGRYVILTCSIASIWFGFLYSDFASLPINLFPSQFITGTTYPFGIDPVWHHAENAMTFTNGLKMKLSLIIGFIHMFLGSAISLLNAIHFKDRVQLYCVSIPQFLAFNLFLGYLVFLCIYKWLVTIDRPSLVSVLIGMYTVPFDIPDPMYRGQLYVQLFILVVILFCIPWMFLSKPFYLIFKKRVHSSEMLDLWINSGIHTIEFGLGLISNTSSYLRLWAVSLAHFQLTSVLHQFTLGTGTVLYKVCIFPVYAVSTALLLIGLEGLSSCLHALRLNWIEFFSKFYTGEGEAFSPLNFFMAYDEIHEN